MNRNRIIIHTINQCILCEIIKLRNVVVWISQAVLIYALYVIYLKYINSLSQTQHRHSGHIKQTHKQRGESAVFGSVHIAVMST